MQAQAGTTAAIPAAAVFKGRADRSAPPAAASPFDALEQFGTRRAFRRGQEVYAAGDPAERCYRVVSGGVRAVGLDEDGRRHVAEFFLPGDLFGLEAAEARHHLSAEAVADTVLVCYPRRAVEAMADRHGALGRRLREVALQGLRRAHETMFLLGRKAAGERVAAFLLEMAARAPADASRAEGARVALPMTRADIADHLGLTIETVSRNMARLCRDGTIASTRRGVEIRDRRALRGFGAGAAKH